MDVEGREFEEAMKDWVTVRRKGQEERQTKQEVKEFMQKYPHISQVQSLGEIEAMMRCDEEGMERVRRMEEYWKAEMERTSGGRG